MTTETKPGTALEIVTPQGELLDLHAAGPERLAEVLVDVDERRVELGELERLVSDELVARLDRRASWTLRVGDPAGDRQFEISAPSPDAGTEAYDGVLLEEELRKLVERRTIDEDAAGEALERTLSVTLKVPLAASLDELVEKLVGAVDVQLAGVTVAVASVGSSRKPKLGAIGKLRKVDGTGAALDRAQLRQSPPARRAKVKVKTRES